MESLASHLKTLKKLRVQNVSYSTMSTVLLHGDSDRRGLSETSVPCLFAYPAFSETLETLQNSRDLFSTVSVLKSKLNCCTIFCLSDLCFSIAVFVSESSRDN